MYLVQIIPNVNRYRYGWIYGAQWFQNCYRFLSLQQEVVTITEVKTIADNNGIRTSAKTPRKK